MKKLDKLTFILGVCLLTQAMANNANPENEEPSTYYLKQVADENPTLKAAMKIEGVETIYKNCFDHQYQSSGGTISGSRLMSCLWEGDQAAGIQGVSANEELKKQVLESVEKDSKGKEVDSIRYQQIVKTKKETEPGLKALQDYYSKKLDEALYGDRTQANYKDKLVKSERTVDQRVFFELQKTQLGKNLVAALSSYCIEAKNYQIGSSFYATIIPEDKTQRQSQRKNNLRKLKQLSATGKDLQASQEWSVCLANIQHMCHQPSTVYMMDDSGNKTPIPGINFSQGSLVNECLSQFPQNERDQKRDMCQDDINYSKSRACEVTQYITESRQNIIALDKTIEKYDELRDGKNKGTINFYSGNKSGESIDDLTSITSNEVVSSGYAQAVKTQAEEMDKCLRENDEELCKQYLNNNKDEAYRMIAEVKLKQEAVSEKLKNIEDGDTEKIKALLLEEGYTEEDAQQMATIDGIKDQINERYDAKKQAIIDQLSAKIEATTTKGDNFNMAEDQAKIENLQNELKQKPQEFAELVHFNNIVSGYLKIDNGEEQTQNTASIARELESNAFTRENLEASAELGLTNRQGGSYDDYANIVSSTGVSLDPGSYDDGGEKTLNTDNINDNLLNYFKKAQTQEDQP
ncbi:hypothetical protein [Bacteriovorax sp. DB6_IX]|uniref:hypothetical protein n=1 Tax=Bacteriovorax sp. DB6_IX TaxID=1353530 RepID=UPI000389DAB2|nr:hypothetical protein [Bacteriovorax sp. DB6_IX]EQC51764.1 hypothetical protein M901_1530 [Bacteriovorax sp. DB6_IX]